jgi:apolipoprotein N-acyltransferase
VKFLLLSFLAGLISACGFEPWSLWPLTIAAFAFLLWLIERAPSLPGALARGWAFGVGNFALGLNWIATAFTFQSNMPAWLGWIAVVLLSLYLAVYPAMAAGLAWRWGMPRGPAVYRHSRESGNPASASSPSFVTQANPADSKIQRDSRFRGNDGWRFVLIFAAAWIVTEWLRANMFTGFAWNPIGVVLIDSWTAWSATLVGTYGLSAILILGAGFAWYIVSLHSRWRFPALAALLLVLLIDPNLVAPRGDARLDRQPLVRIVQPNIGQHEKWQPGFEQRNFERLKRLSGTSPSEPLLLLWPEAAVTDPLEDGRRIFHRQREVMANRAQSAAMLGPQDLLLTGGITFRSQDGAVVSSATNSVFAMDSAGRILGRYDKAHLVPYGEYLPMRPILSRIGLSRLAPGDLDFDPGPGPRTLTLPLVGKVGFQLCYEIIFSGEVVDPRARPVFIFNPSNDAWFGAWGPPQHLAQARLRALEEGLPVLRSTPTGISAVIDASGRVVTSLPWGAAGVIDSRLPPPKPPTLFARLGNLLPFLFALLLVGIAIAVRPKRR